jgi:palmitoyltransferase ZDHHC9/14/18
VCNKGNYQLFSSCRSRFKNREASELRTSSGSNRSTLAAVHLALYTKKKHCIWSIYKEEMARYAAPVATEANTRIRDGRCYSKPRKVGNMILLCGHVDTGFPFHCLVGPDWPCMVTTFVLIIGGGFAVSIYIASHVDVLFEIGMLFLTIVTTIAFAVPACSDPGVIFKPLSRRGGEGSSSAVDDADLDLEIAEKKKANPKLNYSKCNFCQVVRPSTAHHCYDCDVCVDNLDHHCPWTGKCIGRKTLMRFYVFLLAVSLQIVFAIVCTFMYLYRKDREGTDEA